jgi:hypothetical protein
MEKLLAGIPKTVVFIDDILVTDSDGEEHLEILGQVLAGLEEYGVQLKLGKCFFLKPSVEYLGFIVDAEGLHGTPAKMEAIRKAPRPTNVQELGSLLGLVNYYGKFIPHLATTCQPLHRLLGNKVT